VRVPRGVEVRHRRMRRSLGWVRENGRRIRVNLAMDVNPLRVLLHELLHVRHPGWPERRVEREERRRWRRLRDRDLVRLARLLGKIKAE